MTTRRGYARRHLGSGNALKAVTRTRRSAAGQQLGRAPGRTPGPARWRAHERRHLATLRQVATAACERLAAGDD